MLVTTENYGEVAICPYRSRIGTTETWEFLTDISQAFDSTEERLVLRELPRVTWAYSYVVAKGDMPKLFNLFYGAMRKTWAIPLWSEGQSLGVLASGLTEISCVTDIYTFTDKSLALLWQSEEKWQVVEVESVSETGLTLSANTTLSFTAARLYPIKIGFISGSVERTVGPLHTIVDVTYIVDELPEITEITSNTFLGYDINFDCLLLNGDSLDMSFDQQQDIIDFTVGTQVQRTTWSKPTYTKPMRKILKGQQQLYEWKQWLMRRLGAYRPFFMPTYERNLRVANIGAITNTLIVIDDGSFDFAANRLNLAIKANGAWQAVQATSVTRSSATRIQYTLATSLNISASTIQLVSYLGLYRLATDQVEFTYSGAGIVEANTSIIEIEA